MVLGAEVGLDALAVGGAAREDVLAGFVAADEADGLDGRLVQNKVDGAVGAVHDVDDALGEAGLLDEFRQNHGGAGVALRRLEDQRVAGNGGDGDAPQRNHGGEVEGADGRHDTERFPVGARFHVLGHFEELALEKLGSTAGGLGDLQAAQHVALGVGKGLALLEGDAGGETVPVLADEGDELEHDGLAVEDGGVLPRLKSLLGRVDGGLELLVRVLGHAGDEVVGGGVVEVDVLGGGRGDELVVDEPRSVLDVGDLVVGGGIAGHRGL